MNLEFKGVTLRHPAAAANAAAAVNQVSLQVRAGEHIAIIGPSGAGKTTVLHAMACAAKPESGAVLLDGQNPWALSTSALQTLRSRLFLAPQSPPLPPRQRVVTSVLAGQLPAMGFWRSLRSLFYPVDIPAADRALAQLDLSEKLFERVDRLSGGERQRVGLSRLLVADATLWLIDEPLSALDPSRAAQVMQVLTREATARGVSLVVSLHQVEMDRAYFPRIIGLRSGELAFDLPVKDVSDQVLNDLYAQHLDELTSSVPRVDEPPQVVAPVVMHCR